MKTGLGIRPEFFNHVLEHRPSFGFLEAHSENYFRPSLARDKLRALREHYSLSLHGVGLSLGRADALDQAHLRQLKNLVDEVDPILVSEHLAWSAYSHRHVPDLLPLPLNQEAFQTICAHIAQMQDYLQRQILLENPSNYLAFDQLQISEPEFLNSVAKQTGCGLLVDVNNIHVSAHNLQRNAQDYISALDSKHIKQYHLAGYVETDVNGDSVLIDTHNQVVYPEVWALYTATLAMHGPRPTLFEWDSDFPEFAVLVAECEKANRAQDNLLNTGQTKSKSTQVNESITWPRSNAESNTENGLAAMQTDFLDSVINGQADFSDLANGHKQRMRVYENNIFGAIHDYLADVYPATRGVVGDPFFRQMSQHYVQLQQPHEGDIYHYGKGFSAVIAEFSGLQGLPYLSDLIDYEWANHCAYFADVKPAINPANFTQEELLEVQIKLNSGVWLGESVYPIFEIHRQSLPDYEGDVAIDLNQSKDALLVYKSESRVNTRTLATHEMLVLKNIDLNENLLQAIDSLGGSLEADKLSAALALVFELGILTADD